MSLTAIAGPTGKSARLTLMICLLGRSAGTTTDSPGRADSSPVAPALLVLLAEAQDDQIEQDRREDPADDAGEYIPAQRVRHEEPHPDEDGEDDHVERLHSHSIVPGGLDVMSSTTRLTSRISPIMREAICSSRS